MTKQSLGCGRPSEASRDPRVWKATLWIPYGIPCGYHVDTMWSTLLGGTLWSTLGGTLWRPRNPRGYPQNPWILETVSRERQSEERDNSQSMDPKRARRVRRGQIQLTQAAAATQKESGVKEEGLSLRLMSVNRVNPSMWKAIGGKDGISKHMSYDMSRDMPSMACMAIFMESSE